MLAQRINLVADWLSSEARRRERRAKRVHPMLEFVEQAGRLLIEPLLPSPADITSYGQSPGPGLTDPKTQPGEVFCKASSFPRKTWVLLTFTQKAQVESGPLREAEVRITVYFSPHPEFEVTAKTAKERAGKNRSMRAVLRCALNKGKVSSQVMYVDSRSPRRHIAEQLAIFLAQKNFFDDSTQRLLGLRSENPVTNRLGSTLVMNFIDPSSPRSYPAYKKVLLLQAAGPEVAPRARDLAEDETADGWLGRDEYAKPDADSADEGIIDQWGLGQGEDLKGVFRDRASGPMKDNYGIREAANILGTSYRTLYRRIQKVEIPSTSNEWGRRAILGVDLARLCRQEQVRQQDRETRVSLVDVVAKHYGIKLASARRRIRRALNKGKTVREIVIEVSHPRDLRTNQSKPEKN